MIPVKWGRQSIRRYGASATFHLYPFRSVRGVTLAFVVDILCVPCSLCGAVAPFVTAADATRESLVAAAVLGANAACVWWQTRGQVGLATAEDRSDNPRSVVVSLYWLWMSVYVGLQTAWAPLWVAMVALFVLAGALSDPVTKAHEEEPLCTAVPWHKKQVSCARDDCPERAPIDRSADRSTGDRFVCGPPVAGLSTATPGPSPNENPFGCVCTSDAAPTFSRRSALVGAWRGQQRVPVETLRGRLSERLL